MSNYRRFTGLTYWLIYLTSCFIGGSPGFAQSSTVYTVSPSATFSRLNLTNFTLGPLTSARSPSGPFILSSDGKTFYTKGHDYVAAVDRETGNLLSRYVLQHSGISTALAVTPDQTRLFVYSCDFVEFLGCESNYIEVFDVASGQNVGIVSLGPVSTITPSPDSKHIYVTDGGLKVFSVATLQLESSLFADDGFTSFWINPNGIDAYAVSAVDIFVINLAPPTIQETIPIPPYSYATISALSQNGATLAIYSTAPNYTSTIYFLNTSTLALSPPLPFSTYPVNIALNSPGTTAFATDDFGNIHVIDVPSQTIIATPNFSSIGSAVAPDGSAYVELQNGSSIEALRPGAHVPVQLFLSAGLSNWLAVSGTGDTVFQGPESGGISRTALGTSVVTYLLPPAGPEDAAIALSLDGQTVYAVQAGSNFVDQLLFLDAQTGAIQGAITLPYKGEGPGVAGCAIAVNATGDRLMAMEYGPAVMVDPRTQTMLGTINGTGGTGLAFSPDGSTAYISNTGYQNSAVVGAIEVVSRTSVIGSIPIPSNGIVFAPDGTLAYAYTYEGDTFGVAVIDTASLSVTDFISIPEGSSYGGAEALAVTADGSLLYLASPGYPNPGYIIDTGTRQIAGMFPAGNVVTVHRNR